MVFSSKTLQIATVALAAVGLGGTTASAQSYGDAQSLINQMDTYESQVSLDPEFGQGVGAAQFSDVSPSDWAYQALDDLVRRYDCLKGYPNGSFQGSRALSRYEFAAGLNACFQVIERLIAELGGDVDPTDLNSVRRLGEDFAAELGVLGSRVDGLESRVSFLEDNSFSTTTKLTGEVIMAVTSLIGVDETFTATQGAANTATVNNTDNEITFGYRARIVLNTSFTGEDLLLTRLNAGNLATPGLNTANGAPFLPGNVTAENTQNVNRGNTASNVVIDRLAYYFPIGEAQGILGGAAIWSDLLPMLNPYFEDFDGGSGALSNFATESPIYRIGGGSGFSLNYPLGETFTLSAGYLSSTANASTLGLFSGDYALLSRAALDVNDDISLAFTYVHGYHPSAVDALFDLGGGNPTVGTGPANLETIAKISNSYGAEFAWAISDAISFSGFFAYTDAIGINPTGDAEIWTYGAGLAFPDLGGEGNLLGIFAGAQPYLGSGDFSSGGYRVDDTPYHFELFYKYQLTNNISLTPGFIWLTAPNEIDNDALIGTLRTTFEF
ncbi:MAG: iron uptake porin [Cyanobacteria bacterium P01_G01_bin.54]